MKKLYRLTQDGVDEFTQELNKLIARRTEIAEAIRMARELGDLAENAEYQSAREEQERDESRISELEGILQNVEIIKKPKGDHKVRLGSVVKLKSSQGSKEFQIVGTVEADPLNGKISDESPIGMALLNHKVGEQVEIGTTSDSVSYKIIEIA